MNTVNIFTDGSCIRNPGPGGYGIIIKYNNDILKFSSGYYYTTNNRMELMAVIRSLEIIKRKVKIMSINLDSLYVKNGITKWIINWKKNNWKSYKNKTIKNIDLWKKLYVLNSYYILNWNWIKSHSNCIENNLCDFLAKKASINPKNYDIGFNDKYI